MYALINLFNIILEVQANATRQKKEIKDIQIEKEGIKLFAEMTQWPIYRECHRIYKKNLRISEFNKVIISTYKNQLYT